MNGTTHAQSDNVPDTAHFLTNEAIVVDADAASGTWSFLQAGTVHGQALWVGGDYQGSFRRSETARRIARLQIAARLVTPYDQGWVAEPLAGAEPNNPGLPESQ